MKVKVSDETFVVVKCYLPTKNKELKQCATLKRPTDTLIPYADEPLIFGGDFLNRTRRNVALVTRRIYNARANAADVSSNV